LPIPWDTQASLHKAGVRLLAPGQHAIFWTDEVWNGTLAGMLKEWLSKADTLKPLYTIVVALSPCPTSFRRGATGVRNSALRYSATIGPEAAGAL
jgi:hypothetical protein